MYKYIIVYEAKDDHENPGQYNIHPLQCSGMAACMLHALS
jgi:hypothetical protein